MRCVSLALATLLLGISQAQSQNIPGLPECAGSCIGNFGGCGALDVNCICSNSDLLSNLACCVSVECSQQDQDTTLSFAQGICAGSDAELPQSATCAPGAQSTPVTGSSTASAGGSSSATATSGSSSATTTGGSSAPASSSGATTAAGESSASASASSTPNAAVGNQRAESGLGLGLAVAGLIAVI